MEIEVYCQSCSNIDKIYNPSYNLREGEVVKSEECSRCSGQLIVDRIR